MFLVLFAVCCSVKSELSAMSGQLSVLSCTVEKYGHVFSAGRLLFACPVPDRVRGPLYDSMCLTSATVITELLESPCLELAAGRTAWMDVALVGRGTLYCVISSGFTSVVFVLYW